MILAPTVLPESSKPDLQEHRPAGSAPGRSEEPARTGLQDRRSAFARLLDAAAGSEGVEPGHKTGRPGGTAVRGETDAVARKTVPEAAGFRLPGGFEGNEAVESSEDGRTKFRLTSASGKRAGTAGSGDTRGGTLRGSSAVTKDVVKGVRGGPDEADGESGAVKKYGLTGASGSEAELASAAGLVTQAQAQETRPADARAADLRAVSGVIEGGPADTPGVAGETAMTDRTGGRADRSARRTNRAEFRNGTGAESGERTGFGDGPDRPEFSSGTADAVVEGRTARGAAKHVRAGTDEAGRENGGADGAGQSVREERFGTVKDGPVVLEVLDARTGSTAEAGAENQDAGWNDHEALRELESIGTEGAAVRTGHTAQTVRAAADSPAQTAGHSAALLRQLREEANAEIVKNARIVLRDNDHGEIRLRLKPEHLGSVRIELYLEEDRIAGHIFVENETVRDAFEENLRYLQQAFAQEGLTAGELDVSVGNGNREDRQQPGQPHERSRVRELERHVAGAEISHEGYLNLIV